MVPETGAFNHITSGIRELSKHFDLITLLPDKVKEINSSKLNNFSKKINWYQKSGFWGMLRDTRDFINNWNQSKRIKKRLKNLDCKLAYIRVQGFHPLPLILKNCGISVFLEANGLQFENRQQYTHHILVV